MTQLGLYKCLLKAVGVCTLNGESMWRVDYMSVKLWGFVVAVFDFTAMVYLVPIWVT